MKKIEVYYIGLESEPNNGYYEKDIKKVMGAIEALDLSTEGFVVRKYTIDEDKYNALPEFMGF